MARKEQILNASDAVDEQLARYRAMRDFQHTPEPGGSGGDAERTPGRLPFVIQKHAATRLHYDFRLGWNGVLKSWAVAKGPSYNPKDKRLAIEVEDHPVAYGGFEGTIPKGQYGGGTVMIWDQGSWEPQGDADEGLRKGNLKFVLHGQKLQGKWVLVRMGGHFAGEAKPNWLLIKEHDEFERGESDPSITEEAPDSAVTGRNLEAIAAAEDHVWQSDRAGKPASDLRRRLLPGAGRTAGAVKEKGIDPKQLQDFPKEELPGFIRPQLASLAADPPAGVDWLHELKLDGYRIQIRIEQRRAGAPRTVTLFTRTGLDWTHRMRDIATAAAELPVQSAILDGEAVVLDEQGISSFAKLQAAFEEGKGHPLTYFAFDLLHLNGHNLRNASLAIRKELLAQLAGRDTVLRYGDHLRGTGAEMFAQACRAGAEGIISKQADARYTGGRSRSWRKLKCVRQQEFVVGGYTLPANGSAGIGALLLGYNQAKKLVYAGRVGTGYTQAMSRKLQGLLEATRVPKPAFAKVPTDAKKGVIWVSPELVVEVRFSTWTSDDLIRQAAFLGLREDKPASEVTRETGPAAPRAAKREAQSARGRAGSDPPAKASRGGGQAGKQRPQRRESAGRKRNSDDFELEGIRITHPDKVMEAVSGVTKRQLAEYYAAVAAAMLPHIAHRALSVVRCPDGSGSPCFFQKHIGQGMPEGIDSVPVRDKKSGKPEDYLTLATAQGLAGLAQMGVLEVHPWGATNEQLETPDRLIIDLDPDEGVEWAQLVKSAQEVRELLEQLKLKSFVKSTGGKGLHVVAPMAPTREWPEVKSFAHDLVRMMERANPKLYLTKMTKAARKNRIYLDYLRNERGATAVAPYSPRARPGLRVAMPFSWEELKRLKERPEYAVANFAKWKSRLSNDPWAQMAAPLGALQQALTDEAVQAVRQLGAGAA
jgi:bifunctional non-homologous end joining protein LigD